ncbi:head-tail adaptor protein [Sphingomonas sp. H39-1-10]|uniref:head-tail adaptor protein n=1 Tax=Sphingomonas pollutisoli TaxID=3030829 RepID=UPI0023B9D624|nr:head-tail adaptor protein [Sphingomonas pollutisoli]MDF0489205.1 head-tail adaptor protein [Sphingomonas pollutisoli]
MPLAAGRLKHRIELQEQNRVSNGRGGFTTPPGEEPWRTIATRVPAEVIALRGDEAVRHSIERSVQLWRVTIRPRAGVTPTHRLIWNGIAMNIKSAALNVAGDELVMTSESGANGQ